MSYPSSLNSGYYSSDRHYRSNNTTATGLPIYPPADSYGAVYPDTCYGSPPNPGSRGSANNAPMNFNQHTTHSTGGYPASVSMGRSQPTDVCYQNVVYPPYSYENQRSANSFSITSSSTSPVYPASPTRPHRCDQCALSFDRSHDLKRHRESHSGARPFICPSCDKAFTRKDALKRHQSQKQCGINVN